MKKRHIRKRFLFVFLLYITIGGFLIYNFGTTLVEIYKTEREKQKFIVELDKLKEKEDELKGTVIKLQDPDYIARYAREKYLYSKDGEIIIRIPD